MHPNLCVNCRKHTKHMIFLTLYKYIGSVYCVYTLIGALCVVVDVLRRLMTNSLQITPQEVAWRHEVYQKKIIAYEHLFLFIPCIGEPTTQ